MRHMCKYTSEQRDCLGIHAVSILETFKMVLQVFTNFLFLVF